MLDLRLLLVPLAALAAGAEPPKTPTPGIMQLDGSTAHHQLVDVAGDIRQIREESLPPSAGANSKGHRVFAIPLKAGKTLSLNLKCFPLSMIRLNVLMPVPKEHVLRSALMELDRKQRRLRKNQLEISNTSAMDCAIPIQLVGEQEVAYTLEMEYR